MKIAMLWVEGNLGVSREVSAGRVTAMRKAGFDCVSVYWADGALSAVELAEVYRREGLPVFNLHSDFDGCNDVWEDGEAGDALLCRYLRAVDDCAAVGAGSVVVHPSSGVNPPPFCEIGAERISLLARYGEKRGVEICLENLRRLDYLEYLFGRVKSPSLRFCFDAGHDNCRGGARGSLDMFGDRLGVVHLHDNDGAEDMHWLPFDGVADWERVCFGLKGRGFCGPLLLEVRKSERYDFMSDEGFAFEAADRARRLVGLMGMGNC